MTRLHRIADRAGPWVLGAGVLLLAAYIGGVILVINSAEYGADSWLIDFTAFWGAAKMALAGHAVDAFDPTKLEAVQGVREMAGRHEMAWGYPPSFQMLIAPLGLLPFSLAWILFDAVSAALFVLVLRPLVRPVPGGIALVLAAPAVLLSLAIGNNGVLTATCVTAAVVALGAGRQRGAGLLIALMTLKPNLGILVPPVLLAMRQWRAIAWASAGTVAIALISAAVFGIETWRAFLDGLAALSAQLETSRLPHYRMITWYGFARAIGLDHGGGLAVQIVASLAVIAAVSLLWARPRVPFDLKAAGLMLGLTQATPYSYYYEMTFALVGVVFLFRARAEWPPAALALFAAIWLAPAVGLSLSGFAPVASFAAPLVALALVLTLREARRVTAAAD